MTSSQPNRPQVYECYEKIVDWFDTHRYKGLMEQAYLNLILQAIPKQGAILDLGCGTGEPIAKFFVERDYRLTGVDASQSMIERCQRRLPQAKFLCTDMRFLKLAEKFDAIVAWDSFFHLNHEDQRNMFEIFRSHIVSGGILMFTSGFVDSAEEVYGEMNGYQIYHASLATEEYRQLLHKHHFKVIRHTTLDPECGEHTVWVAQAFAKIDPISLPFPQNV